MGLSGILILLQCSGNCIISYQTLHSIQIGIKQLYMSSWGLIVLPRVMFRHGRVWNVEWCAQYFIPWRSCKDSFPYHCSGDIRADLRPIGRCVFRMFVPSRLAVCESLILANFNHHDIYRCQVRSNVPVLTPHSVPAPGVDLWSYRLNYYQYYSFSVVTYISSALYYSTYYR